MICSFRCKETAKIFAKQVSRKFPVDIVRVARRKLAMLDKAKRLSDLKVPPGNSLEPLKAERIGQHSIRINAQWRICFRWTSEGPSDVEMVDYH